MQRWQLTTPRQAQCETHWKRKRYSKLLWAMLALLTRRMPDQHETDCDTANKSNRAEGIQRLKQQRARVRKGEQGMWKDLLQGALQERETRTNDRKTGWILLRSPSGEHRRRQHAKPGTDVSKATVQATLDVIAPKSLELPRDPASLPGAETTRQTSTAHQHPQAHPGTMHQRALTGS